MKIIAFDLGASFAWAANFPKLRWGSTHFEGVRAHRLGTFLTYLQKQKWMSKADILIYECPFTRGLAASRSLWGQAGILEAYATGVGLPVVDANLREIKKFSTGNGMASKVEMLEAARKWGYKGTNDNEGDAVCLLRYGMSNLERA